jgi:hypothetical protein
VRAYTTLAALAKSIMELVVSQAQQSLDRMFDLSIGTDDPEHVDPLELRHVADKPIAPHEGDRCLSTGVGRFSLTL